MPASLHLISSQPAFPAGAPDVQAGSTVEIADLGRILLRRRSWIIGTSVLLTLAALLYGLLTPSLYSSVAEIIVDPQNLQVVTNDVSPSQVSPDGGIAQVESQVSVVQSNGVLLRAIAATNLTEDPEFNGQSALAGWLTSEPAPTDRTVATLDGLKRRLAVKRADKVLVIDVIVTTRSADKSAILANAIAKAYLADQADARAQAAKDAADAISARLEEQRKRVEQAENAVAAYKADNNMVVAAGVLVSDQELTDLNTQLAAAQSRTETLRAQVDQLRRQNGAQDATSEAMRSTVIANLRTQEATLVAQVSQLEMELGPRHPSMLAAQKQLRDTRLLIARELARISGAAQTDYERALANQRALEAKVAALKGKSLDTDQASVRLRELQRDLEAVRLVYSNYLQRAQETREQINVNNTNARIISEALPAQKKSWPPLGLLLFGAVLGGLGLGTGLALIAEYLSPTALSADQVQAAIGAPVLGVLPWRSTARRAGSSGGRSVGTATQQQLAAANLAFGRMFRSGKRPPDWPLVLSILVTSAPADAEQRRRVAGLLADVAASKGSRVLLVDSDGVEGQKNPEPGMFDVLRGEYPVESVCRYSQDSRVARLRRGRAKAGIPEAGGTSAAWQMLARMRRSFEIVVIDGGSLSDDLTASVLVPLADETVIVASLNSTPMSDVNAAVQAMSAMGRLPTCAMLADEAA